MIKKLIGRMITDTNSSIRKAATMSFSRFTSPKLASWRLGINEPTEVRRSMELGESL